MSSRPLGFLLCQVLAAVLLAVIVGCGAASKPGSSTDHDGESTQYTVRGLVKDVSGLAADPRRLRIFHEAVDDLVGVDGELDPMRAMTMNLMVMREAELPSDLAPDDKVKFVLDVAWERSPVAMIRSVERLDPAVELNLP